MTHFWLRAEERANEKRSPLTPEGARALLDAGHKLTVEENPDRCFDATAYEQAGATLAPAGSWRTAPQDAVILGLKELPDDGSTLPHRHIMFGHAFKGQPEGPALLARFAKGGGTLLDIEYLTDTNGRRQAAFGYWAGYAGAAVTVLAYAAGLKGTNCPAVSTYASAEEMAGEVRTALDGATPRALVIGALGRVGSGVRALCQAANIPTTDWDMAETASGGPFPEILEHELFFNSILAGPGCPVFVPESAVTQPRKLRAIGDIACDPGSDYNPVPLYEVATSWAEPVVRVASDPILDVMAIDNLPSLLPLESSEDFAGQLLPMLVSFDSDPDGIWARAGALYSQHSNAKGT